MSDRRGPERRRHPRSNVVASASVLRHGRHLGTFLVNNLSAGGALLMGACALEVGAELQLLLYIGKRAVHARAHVVRGGHREDARGFAVVFEQLAPHIQDWIQQVVLADLERKKMEADDGQRWVLIVDDELPTARALARDLDRLALKSLLAVAPFDAFSHLYGGGREIVAVFADLHLGWTNGLDLLAFFAAEHPRIRRVLVSADLDACAAQREDSGTLCHAIIEKPWTRQVIEAAVAGT